MFAQFGAKRAAVQAAAQGFNRGKIGIVAGVALAAVGLARISHTIDHVAGWDGLRGDFSLRYWLRPR